MAKGKIGFKHIAYFAKFLKIIPEEGVDGEFHPPFVFVKVDEWLMISNVLKADDKEINKLG